MVLVPTSPGTLAVLMGVVELFILESFRFLVSMALAANRSLRLTRFGKLHLVSAARQNDRWQIYVSVISVMLVVVLIVLELSIDGVPMPSTGSPIQAMCYAPDRLTRYTGGFGPYTSEADDTRFPVYLEKAGCMNSLLSTALSGTGGLRIGYPKCTMPFDKPKQRSFVSDFRGCGVGFVGESESGDFHCDVLPTGVANQSMLAGNSFLGVFESGRNSSSLFKFNAIANQRYLSNARVPHSWMLNNTEQSVSVDCRDLSLECNELSRERASSAAKSVHTSRASFGIYIQALQNGNSTVCLFENGMRSQAWWLEMDQRLPGADERTRRSGPILTGFQVSGEARCVLNLDSLTARLHYDATEFASSLPEGNILNWIQRHVVATGIKTPFASSRQCDVVAVIEGSSMDLGWFIATCILSCAVMLFSVAALMHVLYVRLWCKLKKDPLTPLWPIREVIRMREAERHATHAPLVAHGDVFVGVVEKDGVASFDVYANDNFEAVRCSKKPFMPLFPG